MPKVFISYVHDNRAIVDKLASELRRAGVKVWLDRDEITPGERWQDAIREAIREGDFFIACFSAEYIARPMTYMNAEIGLAVEMLQQMPMKRVWFIPVLLSECEVPDRTIGGGETLRSLQWEPLYKDWERGTRRILKAMGVDPAFTSSTAPSVHLPYRLQSELGELQRSYDDLNRRIADVYTDLGHEMDSERRLMLEERRAELAASREKTASRMAEIEKQLAQIAEQKPASTYVQEPKPAVEEPASSVRTETPPTTTAKAEPVQPEVKQPAPTVHAEAPASAEAVPVPPLVGDLAIIDKPIHLELIRIPAGEFLMGDDKHPVDVAEFYIGKYPITNAQYAVFVQERGDKRQLDHWEKGRIPAGKDNHPVAKVSWRDSVAFCDWLSQATGRKFRLPTEAEWEKAARGTDGRRYPWDDEFHAGKCNTMESSIHDTTPVGKYSPAGDSPYGVADMAGNVWEWCLNEYDNPERVQVEGNATRVLRGGSWHGASNGAAAPFRLNLHPDLRLNGFGFRVVVVGWRPTA